MMDEDKTKKQLILEINSMREELDHLKSDIHFKGENMDLCRPLTGKEELYNVLFKHSQDYVFILGLDGNIIDFNYEVEKIGGLNRHEIVGKHFSEFKEILGGDISKHKRFLEDLIRGESVTPFDSDFVSTTGKKHIMKLIPVPIEKNGNLRSIMVIMRDLTDYVESMNALSESEEKFRSLVESASDAIILINKEGNITLWNESASNMFGFSENEIIGSPIERIIPEDYSKFHEGSLSYPINCEVEGKTFEGLGIKKNGETFSIDVSHTSWLMKGEPVFCTIIRDVSRRKKAENELIGSQKKYKTIFENTGTAMCIVEKDGTISLTNTEFTKTMGYSADYLEGANLKKFTKTNFRKIMDYQRLKSLNPDTAPVKYELNFFDSKKTLKTAMLNIAGIPGTDKTLISLLDITELKKSEQKIVNQNKILNGFNKIFKCALSSKNQEELAKICLNTCEEITESKLGFIQLLNKRGNLDFVALSDPAWEVSKFLKNDKEFLMKDLKLQGIYARPVVEEKSIIVKDPSSHPNSIGLPKGHFPLECFLGVPLKRGNKIIGVIGLANKKEDYGHDDVETVEKLSNAIAEVLTLKHAEEKLIKSQEKFRQMAENVEEGVWISDVGSKNTMYVNPAYEKIFGLSKESIHKNPGSWMDILHHDDVERVSKHAYRIFHKHEFEQKRIEYRIIRSDGSIRWIQSQISPIKNENGEIIRFVGVTDDVTERVLAEEKIQKSLEEKELLLKEIHHRVKNNMQIVSSLLNLQSRYIDDEEAYAVFKESQNRVKSMALVHEKLYRSTDLASVNFGEYVRSLSKELLISYGSRSNNVAIKTDLDDVFLNADTAIPCGLIVTEIISNSIKYAFDGEGGEICVGLHRYNGGFEILIGDNGVGIPEDMDLENTETLGLLLINSLTSQIDGEVELLRKGGTSFRIKIPLNEDIILNNC
ncbi:PAS domain S-box-containing protein [Methanobacterium aggregans]|nr:PAS domain S-box-containing protein [Methanobacterium aggregans]